VITTMLPVADVERASRFYAEMLGLHHRMTAADGTAIFDGGNGSIGLLRSEPGTQSERTALSFEVDDLGAEIGNLEGRGVVFDDYDLPDLKTVNHIAEMGGERAAWFRDTDGNILCLHEAVAANT